MSKTPVILQMQGSKKNLKTQKQRRSSEISGGRMSCEHASPRSASSPRTHVTKIKQFHQQKYGIPCDTQILYGSSFDSSYKRTYCESCKIKTQNVEISRCGKVSCLWSLILLPLCLCLIPRIFESFKDQQSRCVLCWQTKEAKPAKFCNCA